MHNLFVAVFLMQIHVQSNSVPFFKVEFILLLQPKKHFTYIFKKTSPKLRSQTRFQIKMFVNFEMTFS